jgi:hypothetical protein
MGACDGFRRLEPVAPAVGDRPSIGDEARPRQSDGPDRAAWDGSGPEAGPWRGGAWRLARRSHGPCAAKPGHPARRSQGHLARRERGGARVPGTA